MRQIHVTDDKQTTFCQQAVAGQAYCHPARLPAWLEGDPVPGVEVCPPCLEVAVRRQVAQGLDQPAAPEAQAGTGEP